LNHHKRDQFSVIDLFGGSKFAKTQAIGYDVADEYNLNS
jgi:hypothetical protein